jgi:hypothetical protein
MDLAERLELTLYNAAYLELAVQRNLPLATLNEDLRRLQRRETQAAWGAKLRCIKGVHPRELRSCNDSRGPWLY